MPVGLVDNAYGKSGTRADDPARRPANVFGPSERRAMRESTMRDSLRRLLLWTVLLSVLLPVALAVIVGLGALLAAVGDEAGAAACGRVCLVVGAGWLMALAGTATATGILAVKGPRPGTGRKPGGRRPDEPPAGR